MELVRNSSNVIYRWNNYTSLNGSDINVTSTTPFTFPEPLYPPWGIGLLSAMAGVTSLCTIVGNILVVLAFILEKNLRQPSNYLIASLAITDLLIGLFSMPFYTLYLLMVYWPLGQILCDLWLSLDYTVCLVSQYTVFLITLDRFCSVKAPAKYRNWRTTRKIKVMIAVTWFVPALIFFTSILGWRRFTGTPPPTDYTCYAEFQNDQTFTVILTISYYWVTLVIMIGLYIGIYRVALSLHTRARQKRNRMKQMKSLSNKNQNSNDSEPLNMPKQSNGSASRGLPRNNSSRLREDSDFSNEHSSDSTISKRRDSMLPISTPISAHTEDQSNSPLWKPRDNLPPSNVHWDAFSDSTYSTLQRTESTLIDGASEIIREEDTADESHEKLAQDSRPSAKNRILTEVTKVFTQINKVKWCKKRGEEGNSPKRKSRSENRARKALRTITFILGAFVICWTPYHVVVIISPYCKDCINGTLFNFTYWLCYMNSPINPFCYALSNQQFKQAFIKILKGEYFRGRNRCFKGYR